MNRTLVHGGVLALASALTVLGGDALGLTSVWPVLLAAAVGVALGLRLGRVAAFAVGATVSWLTLAIRAGVLPDVVAARALVALVAVLLLTAVALVSRDRLPLWASLAGFAAFAGVYEPLYASAPTAFLSESPVAFVTVLLAASIGFLAVAVAGALGVTAPAVATREADDLVLVDAELVTDGGAK